LSVSYDLPLRKRWKVSNPAHFNELIVDTDEGDSLVSLDSEAKGEERSSDPLIEARGNAFHRE
jgi:hypothetical protein